MGHSVARKWAASLRKYGEYSKTSPEVRYFAFPGEQNQQRVVQGIRRAIDVINAWSPQRMEVPPEGEWTQELLNHWHHHFETMIGSIEQHEEFYLKAPLSVKNAIGAVNDAVHELEMFKYQSPRLNVRFPDCERTRMTEDELRLFSFDRQFGDIVLGYCQLGKQIMDVWIENDSEVSEQNIRPLHHLSPEFELYLRKGLNEERQKERYALMREWLVARGYDPHDPQLALGWIVVARWNPLSSELKPSEIVQRIGERRGRVSVCMNDQGPGISLPAAPPAL